MALAKSTTSSLATLFWICAASVLICFAPSLAFAQGPLVSLASVSSSRAVALSAPALDRPADMTLHAGDTADQPVQATDVDGDPLTFSVNLGLGSPTAVA